MVFCQTGERVSSSKKKPHVGILHESSDWKLSVDFDSSLVFPSFIAITASRPDIVIYSVLKKTVILNKLTSPCEENFEDRHFDKLRENGWRHHLFAIEVGARGYSAYNVRSCFRHLGLNTKETKVVLSELTSTAIQCSFVIWLNRDNRIWNEQATSTFDIYKKDPRKHITPFKNKVSKPKYSQPLSKFYRPGFISKGNTCYMNALLQALSVLTGFWSTLPALASEEHHISPLVAAYCQIMFFLQSSKNPIDPSCFLDAFSRFMVRMGRDDFVVNTQQNVPEVLNYL